MITLKRLNVVKEVASEEAAQKFISQGFKRIEETAPKDTKGEEKAKGSKGKNQKPDNEGGDNASGTSNQDNNGGGDNASGTGNQDNNGGKSES